MAHTSFEMPSPFGPGHPIDLAFRGSTRKAALARAIELLPRRAVAELAVAEVGDGEVFQIAAERGGIRLDGVGRDAELVRALVRAVPEVDAALERDAENHDARVGRRRVAGDEAG
jgi:hypothetical protein